LVDKLTYWSSGGNKEVKRRRFSESPESEDEHLSRIIDDPGVACRHYDLPTFDPDMMKFIVDHEPLQCWDESPLYADGGSIRVRKLPGTNIRCNFTGEDTSSYKFNSQSSIRSQGQ
jgi:hypothetical protein